MRKLLFACAAVLTASASSAQPQRPASSPRLLVVISVDQLSADLWDEYRPQFTGGFARLAGGTVFRNGYQAHAATETCPGHSNLLTGLHPARNGIVANNWIDQSIARPDKAVYCAEDERVPRPAGTTTGAAGSYTVSPYHLRGRTLGELLKTRWPGSFNVAVAAKDRAAVMMSGHRADQRWYWDGKKFVTDLVTARVPATVPRANAAFAAALAAPRAALVPPAVCQAKSAPIAVTPTLTVGPGRFARAAGDSHAFRISPEMDGATLALAAGLIRELGLGRDASPDLLSIGLSATDYVGHAYGPGGGEMCLHLLSVDRDLGDFFRLLDSQRLDYSVVLTADHGSLDIPQRLRPRGFAQAAYVDSALGSAVLGKAIGAKLGLAGPVLLGDLAADVYIDRALSAADRARVEREAVAFYTAHPQVAAVFTARQLRARRVPTGAPDRWSLAERVRASFDPQRSGDLYVALKQHVMPIASPATGYVSTHGSPWDYDRRVPILFWRPGAPAANRNEPVSVVDILPTLGAMYGLGPQTSSDGKCLTRISDIACPSR